jgi:hypothetical protein
MSFEPQQKVPLSSPIITSELTAPDFTCEMVPFRELRAENFASLSSVAIMIDEDLISANAFAINI